MNNKEIVAILRKAHRLLSNPKKHTKGWFARDGKGEDTDPRDPKAACFCAFGALDRYSPGGEFPFAERVRLNELSTALYGAHLVTVNDKFPRGRVKVLRVFKEAIERLSA